MARHPGLRQALVLALALLVSTMIAACAGQSAGRQHEAAPPPAATAASGFGAGFGTAAGDGGTGPSNGEDAAPPSQPPEPSPVPRMTADALLASLSVQEGPGIDDEIAGVASQRVIIRTVNASLVVASVQEAITTISNLARTHGGWVVASEQQQRHQGAISFRVPAELLDDVLGELRALAIEVESERSTSQDFTEEHTDLVSRIENLRSTETALRALFERAETVEDAVTVQNELSRVLGDLEQLQGRLSFLQQSAAFSLVSVALTGVPQDIPVNAGADIAAAVGEPVRFRATFTAPDDLEEFYITWDFGDGSNPVVVTRTTRGVDDTQLMSAPVTHSYSDERDSPFVVRVKVTGAGGIVVEGSDTLTVTVSRIPAIEVFAGSDVTTEAGKSVNLTGSFTRPEGLEDLSFSWDFGDGSAPVTGDLPPGLTTVRVSHVYENHRPTPYTARLTVTGESAAGMAEGASTLQVRVKEPQPWMARDWALLSTSQDAVRALSEVMGLAVRGAIWAMVLSPVWLIAAAAVWGVRKARAGNGGERIPRRRSE